VGLFYGRPRGSRGRRIVNHKVAEVEKVQKVKIQKNFFDFCDVAVSSLFMPGRQPGYSAIHGAARLFSRALFFSLKIWYSNLSMAIRKQAAF
jgi:hypothetical protein